MIGLLIGPLAMFGLMLTSILIFYIGLRRYLA